MEWCVLIVSLFFKLFFTIDVKRVFGGKKNNTPSAWQGQWLPVVIWVENARVDSCGLFLSLRGGVAARSAVGPPAGETDD